MLHRDLKPSNVLFVRNDSTPPPEAAIRAANFRLRLRQAVGRRGPGIAVHDGGRRLTWLPRKRDWADSPSALAADIYGLGAILYELLTGETPFQGTNLADVFDQMRNNEPIPLRQLRPDIPRDLEAICLKCLQREPQDRFQRRRICPTTCNDFSPANRRRRDLPAECRIGRTWKRRKIGSRLFLSALLLGIVASAAVSRRVHESSVAARTKAAAQSPEVPPPGKHVTRLISTMHSISCLTPKWAAPTVLNSARQAREILKYVPQADEPELRGFEWHYLWKSLHPSQASPSFPKLHEIPAHHEDAYFVAFSPDGTRLATTGKDGTARVWQAENRPASLHTLRTQR